MTKSDMAEAYRRMDEEYGEMPWQVRHSLWLYLAHGYPVGDFLSNLLENNLCGTFSHADHNNLKHIGLYIKFLYNHAPLDSWGGKGVVASWRERVKETPTDELNVIFGWGVLWLRDSTVQKKEVYG